MSKQWKPGDVAAVQCSDGKWRQAMFNLYQGRWTWSFGDATLRDADTSVARPLVVIDPENREEVERLGKTLFAAGFTATGRLQDALREFADPKPPKPEEPTAKWSVVVDRDGDEWVRLLAPSFMDGWVRAEDLPGLVSRWTCYADINAVRVLSEGVQS